MVDTATGVMLVFNGEIYNFQELRTQLLALGHAFRTQSDTEVLLRSYLEWRDDAVQRLVGMFAFAIWDPRESKLFLARDRLGIKPLYWTQIGNDFLFASEIKAFFEHPSFRVEPDLEAVSSYLTFRQATWDLCYFKGVNKVLPGHTIAILGSTLRESTYWSLPIRSAAEPELAEGEYIENAEAMLSKALGRCLVSDVPLGLYLSGGLDSAILAALMKRQHSESVRSFSVGYGEDGYDEGQNALETARQVGTDHTHVVLGQREFRDLWPKLVVHRDVPLSIPHEVPLLHLSRELKKRASVAIAGEGADELFGGYGRVLRSAMDWRKVAVLRRILPDSVLTHLANSAPTNTVRSWLSCARHVDHFVSVYNWMPLEEKWGLFTQDALHAINSDRRCLGVFEDCFTAARNADPYDRVFHVFQKIHLGCLLEKLDAVGMAASVEGRVPFVDHELVEMFVKMPVRHKLRWKSRLSQIRALATTADVASERLDTPKWLLRKVASRLLSPSIARRKKLGFPTPLDGWLGKGFSGMAQDLLLDSRARQRGIFRPDAVGRLLDNRQNLPYDFYGKKVWMLMNIEMWYREVIEVMRQPRPQQQVELIISHNQRAAPELQN